MTFNSEFPKFPASDYPVLPAGFIDSSWQLDLCPSMLSETLRLSIMVDYADPAKREIGADSNRFIIFELDSACRLTDGMPLLATDSWNEVLAFIAKREA